MSRDLDQRGGRHAQSRPHLKLAHLRSARDLQATDFPPVSWVIEGFLPEGVAILAGKPKSGKSWLALQMGSGVAGGSDVLGRVTVQGSVLYAALEDNNRRLKARLEMQLPPPKIWPTQLFLATEWPRIHEGGLDTIERWVANADKPRLVIIDTLATIRSPKRSNEGQYQADYMDLRGLHRIAAIHGIAILIVHHVRKAEADDPFDKISGTNGLAGAADTTFVLCQSAGGKVLKGRGRDLAELDCALSFDAKTGLWTDQGQPSEAHATKARQEIRSAMENGHSTPKEITRETGIDYDVCAKTLQRMVRDGGAEKLKRGTYRLVSNPLDP